MPQQRFDAAETLAKRKEAARGGKRDNLVNRAIQLERNHPAKAGHLLAGNIVARMRSKAGKVDTTAERLVLERSGNGGSILFVALHSEFERLKSAQGEPTI